MNKAQREALRKKAAETRRSETVQVSYADLIGLLDHVDWLDAEGEHTCHENCRNHVCTLRRERDAALARETALETLNNKVLAERDDLLLLHTRTVSLVFPGERDSPGAYRKLLKDAEDGLAAARAESEATQLRMANERLESEWAFMKDRNSLREKLAAAKETLERIKGTTTATISNSTGTIFTHRSESSWIAEYALAKLSPNEKEK